MFGLGMPEIFLILAIALIVIGPKKLPELAKTLGRAMGEFKRSAQDFKKSIDIETTLKDIETPASDLKDIIKDVNKGKETIVESGVEFSGESIENTDMTGSKNQDINTDNPPETNADEPDSPAPKHPENKTQQP